MVHAQSTLRLKICTPYKNKYFQFCNGVNWQRRDFEITEKTTAMRPNSNDMNMAQFSSRPSHAVVQSSLTLDAKMFDASTPTTVDIIKIK
jgi:hypothetical protein